MKRYNLIYRHIGVGNAIVHSLLMAFLMIVSFLPFYDDCNFYQFGGLYLLIPLAATVLAWLAVKWPLWFLLSLALTGLFFFVLIFCYTVDVMIVGFSSPWVDSAMGDWQQGFTVMTAAVNILYWDAAFGVYAAVTAVVRMANRKREKRRIEK